MAATVGFGQSPSANPPTITVSNAGSTPVGIAAHATYNTGSRPVTDFHIERNYDNGGWNVVSWSGNDTSFSDSTPGSHTVQYKCAVSDDHAASWHFSDIVSQSYSVAATTSPSANTPTISVSNEGSATVGISANATYSAGSLPVTDFHIERSYDGGAWNVVSWSGNDTGYNDTTPGSHTVQYKCAVSDDHAASWHFSGIATRSYAVATPTPPSANTPVITLSNNNTANVFVGVTATYSAGSAPVTDFHIERNYDNGGWSVVSFSGNDGSYSDTNTGNHSVQFKCAVSDDHGANWHFSNVATTNYTVSRTTTLPTVSISAPGSANLGSTITPSATTYAGTYQLGGISLKYSWDNVNWTELAATPNCSNPQTVSNPVTLNQSGTLYLRADAWDIYANNSRTTAAVQIGAGGGFLIKNTGPAGTNWTTWYNYGPSWLVDSSAGTEQVWWTSIDNSGGGDAMFYSYRAIGGYWSLPQQVLNQTDWGPLAPRLLSNPCVIKGSFVNPNNNTAYQYAMYYIESDTNGAWGNYIGLAFSHDGISWTNLGTPLFTPVLGGTAGINGVISDNCFGAGYPSVMHVNGQYVMFYTDSNQNTYAVDAPVYYRTSLDGVHWSSTPSLITTAGFPSWHEPWLNNPSISYSPVDGCYYLATGPNRDQNGNNSGAMPIYLYKIPAGQILGGGSWQYVSETSASALLTYKGNIGWQRDPNGNIPDISYPTVAFGSNDTGITQQTQIYFWSY